MNFYCFNNNELKLKSGKGEIFLLTKNSKNNGGIFLFAQFLVLQPMLVLDRVSANFPDIIFLKDKMFYEKVLHQPFC